MKRLLLLALFVTTPHLHAADRYIIPVWGERIQGWSAQYSSTIVLTNLTEHDATVRVVDVLPMVTEECPGCADSTWTLRPSPSDGSMRVISDQGTSGVFFHGKHLRYGAVVLEADSPVLVESDVFTGLWGEPHVWQSVDVATGWIPGGTTGVIPRAVAPDVWSDFTLYLLNPNDAPITVEYWISFGGRRSSDVPAHSMIALRLPIAPFLAGTAGAELATGFAFPLYVTSSYPFLAAAGGRSPSLPTTVHVARAAGR